MAIRDDSKTPTTSGRGLSLVTFASGEHLALLASLVGALIFAFRCVIVSEGDPYVASIVATQTSIGDAIRALLFPVVPVLLLGLWLAAAYAAAKRIILRRWREPQTLGLLVVSPLAFLGSVYLAGFSPALGTRSGSIQFTFGLIAIAPLAFFVVSEYESSRKFNKVLASITNSIFALVVLVAIAASLANKTFWLPPERLAFQSEVPFTGYVLKVSEDYVVVLNDSPRIIVEKPKASLRDRDFCYPEDHKARSSNLRSDSPACP
jgi:hypothetical protein